MRLETSQDLLERLRARYGTSWYGLAPLIGTHENTIANWKNGRTVVDRRFAQKIGDLLGEPAEYVLACLEAQRETEPGMRRIWERIATKFRNHAASILLVGVGLLGVGSPAPAEAFKAHGQGDMRCYVYYGKSRRRRWFAWLPVTA